MCTEFWLESLKRRDLDIHGRIILKWILKRFGGCGLDSSGSEWGSCGHGNEPSGSIKGREFLD
jgi:hypothetical protein